MSDPRNHDHGPERVPSYGHQFGLIHDRVVGDGTPDHTFHSKISNKQKTDYVCAALRLDPRAFNLDLPFPLEDWAASDDLSLINAGLYFADLKRQFYETLLTEHKEMERTPAWAILAEAEFWNVEFNRTLVKRTTGSVMMDGRVLN